MVVKRLKYFPVTYPPYVLYMYCITINRNGPYELQAQGEKETLIQKFNRLKCEITELEEELVQAKVLKLLHSI